MQDLDEVAYSWLINVITGAHGCGGLLLEGVMQNLDGAG